MRRVLGLILLLGFFASNIALARPGLVPVAIGVNFAAFILLCIMGQP